MPPKVVSGAGGVEIGVVVGDADGGDGEGFADEGDVIGGVFDAFEEIGVDVEIDGVGALLELIEGDGEQAEGIDGMSVDPGVFETLFFALFDIPEAG